MKLKLTYMRLDALREYEGNSRTHSPEQVAEIAASIRRFGFNDPIGLRAGVIAEGHGRLAAARLLDLDKVPVIHLDHLDDAQFRAYVIAHNRLAEKAGWDMEALSGELQALVDLDMDLDGIGFDAKELDDLFNEFTGDLTLEGAMDANAAGAHSDVQQAGQDEPDGNGEAGAEKKAPPIRVPILIELSAAENARWREIKKALNTQDNSAAFKHVAGIEEIQA